MTYTVYIGSWNGACYETFEHSSFDDLAAAQQYAAEVEDGDWGEDYDLQVVIQNEDGDEVHSEVFRRDSAAEAQDEMNVLIEDEAEFATLYLGYRVEYNYGSVVTIFARWEANGGYRGAFDRTDGSGRWIERYEEPVELEPHMAMIELIERYGWTPARAARKIVALARQSLCRDDFVDALIEHVPGIEAPQDAARAMPGVSFT